MHRPVSAVGFSALTIVIALVGRAVAACGSEDDSSNGDSTDAALDADGDDDGEGGADSGRDAARLDFGSVTIFTQRIDDDAGAQEAYFINATFSRTTAPAAPVDAGAVPKCETLREGGCSLTLCPIVEGGTPGPVADAGPPPNAGRIEITGAAIGDSGVLRVSGDGRYASANGNRLVFSGGEEIAVRWEGQPSLDLGPPAGSLTFRAPTPVAMLSPFSPGMSVPRDQDLVLRWSAPATQPDDASIGVLVTGQVPNKRSSLTCNFAAKDGSGTVGKSLLGPYAPGAGGLQITVSAGTDVIAGTWNIHGSGMTTTTSNRGVAGVEIVFP